MSNASQTEAYRCLQHHEEELPTLIKSDEAPSLIAIPSWPPAPPFAAGVQEKRRVAEALPLPPPASPAPPAVSPTPSPAEATFGHAPHELSPFDRSSFDRSSFDRPATGRSSFDRSSFDRSSLGRAPHELSPFDGSTLGRSAQQRVASSPLTLLAAYAALGASAFWAAWSVARFM